MDNLTGEYTIKNKKKNIPTLALQFILCRIQGGKLYKNLVRDINDKAYRDRLPVDLLIFLTGERAAFFLFPKKSVEIIGEYTSGNTLYHLTPKSNLDSIKKRGLVSRNYIFLTDSVEYLLNDNFFNWKATKLKKDTDFCILKINSAELCKKHKLMLIKKEHEIITDKVEPEFIIFA